MNSPVEPGIHRVSHDIKRRRLEVLRVIELTPRMRRITLGGAELAGFVSLGSDDHVKLLFASTPEQQVALETLPLGALIDDAARPLMRDYTPRRIDLQAGEMDIDFVLHGDGPAASWAAQATPGQSVYIAGPRGSLIVPDIFDSYLLIGDETALPAIARRLETLAAGRKALVVVEVEDRAEEQPLRSAAELQVLWLHRAAPGHDLPSAVQALQLPEGRLYAWVATEAALSRRVRRVLLEHFELDENLVKAAGYWRLDEQAPE